MLAEATNAWPREFGLSAEASQWVKQVFEPLHDPMFYGQTTPEEFISKLQEKHDEFYAAVGG